MGEWNQLRGTGSAGLVFGRRIRGWVFWGAEGWVRELGWDQLYRAGGVQRSGARGNKNNGGRGGRSGGKGKRGDRTSGGERARGKRKI